MRSLLVCLLALCWLFPLVATAEEDFPGSADHPIISRYPDTTIRWYNEDNHRPYRIPVGPVTGYRKIDEWLETEGRLTRIYYTHDGGGKSVGEIFTNYRDAIVQAGFMLIADGFANHPAQGVGIGSRQWRQILFNENSWNDARAAVNEMVKGSSTSGTGGSLVAHKERAEGTAYLVVSVYQYRIDRIGILVDVLEQKAVESGLITVDAEAIGRGIEEQGRKVLDGLFFDFDKATLQDRSAPALQEIAKYLKAHPDQSFYVVGHTDAKGTLNYNINLSRDRARSVIDALVTQHQIPSNQLEPHGVGPLSPVFANTSDAGRERNRRVELVER